MKVKLIKKLRKKAKRRSIFDTLLFGKRKTFYYP